MLRQWMAWSSGFALVVLVYAEGTAAAQETSGPPAPAAATDPAAEEVVAPPRATAKKSAEEEIVVTGSRIRRKDLTTPAPVTVISREQVVASGKVSIGDFLQSLPEQGNAINTAVNNGADSSADLNSIPTGAIDHIEILKDGASAIYGSDAIAGVVNIIMRKRYNGTEATGFGSTTTRGDGNTYDLNLTTGTSSDRGSIVFSGGFFKNQSIMAGDRAFSATPIGFDSVSGKVITQGSGTIPQGRFIISPKAAGKAIPLTGDPTQDARIALYNQLVLANPKATAFIHCVPGDAGCIGASGTDAGWRVYAGSKLATDTPPGDGYNFQPRNYLLTPQQRISLYTSGEARLASNVRGYFDASYVNRQSEQQLAPEPLLTDQEGDSGIIASAQSIYNPFGTDVTTVRRRLLEFGNRVFNQDIDTFRIVGGVDGTVPELNSWFWDVSLNYGRTESSGLKNGNIRTPKLQDAIGPSFLDSSGVAHCGTPGKVIAGCVPLDLFHGAGSITQDQVVGLTYSGTQRGYNQMTSVQLNTNGELFRLMSDRPVGIGFGYEYRNLLGADIPDPITVAGETSGNKSLITRGGYHVNEGYGELVVPILSNRPGVEQLEASAALRVFNYSTFGTDYTYKFGGRWQMVRDFTLRGTYSTAFRAPSISDLFLGQQDNFASVTDPCAKPASAGIAARCGSAAGNGDDQTQLRSKVGGNPKLQPETAKAFTLGVVIEPRMVRNLSVTVDYYNFVIDQAIGQIGEDVILSNCYTGDGKYCDLIQRRSNGTIDRIFNLQANVGSDKTDGIDIAARYSLPSEYGRFGFIFDGTWLHKFNRTLANGDVIHARGTYDLGQGNAFGGVFPAWKFNVGTSWALGGFGAGVNSRFVGKFKECGDDSGVMNGSGLCYKDHIGERTVHPYVAFDAFLSYGFRNPVGRTAIAAGLLNVFDRQPPVIYNNGFSFSDPSSYDYAGRRLYARLTQTF